MIAPGFRDCGSVVAAQAGIPADGGDKLPGLLAANGLRVVMRPGVEPTEVVRMVGNPFVGRAVPLQRFLDTAVDHHFVSFAPFFFPEPEAVADFAPLIDEIADPQ